MSVHTLSDKGHLKSTSVKTNIKCLLSKPFLVNLEILIFDFFGGYIFIKTTLWLTLLHHTLPATMDTKYWNYIQKKNLFFPQVYQTQVPFHCDTTLTHTGEPWDRNFPCSLATETWEMNSSDFGPWLKCGNVFGSVLVRAKWPEVFQGSGFLLSIFLVYWQWLDTISRELYVRT